MVNNDYTHWEMYAVGGSADPTINSQGNRFLAPSKPSAKEVSQNSKSKKDGLSLLCRCLLYWFDCAGDQED